MTGAPGCHLQMATHNNNAKIMLFSDSAKSESKNHVAYSEEYSRFNRSFGCEGHTKPTSYHPSSCLPPRDLGGCSDLLCLSVNMEAVEAWIPAGHPCVVFVAVVVSLFYRDLNRDAIGRFCVDDLDFRSRIYLSRGFLSLSVECWPPYRERDVGNPEGIRVGQLRCW